MPQTTFEMRRASERMDRAELETHQLARLNELLREIIPHNAFYARKLEGHPIPLRTWDDFRALPFTTKAEIISGSSEGFAANRTYSLDRYVRFHRTSGTHGSPLVVLDTADDWQWWIDVWQYVLDVAELDAHDRVLMAFSFGPFIGFWTAHDAVIRRGALVIPGGGMSSLARLNLIRAHRVTALFCTPSYALHLAEVAEQNQIDATGLGVRRIIVAGEPGGSAPAVCGRIEKAWNARVVDHAGASEVGPWGYADVHGRGLRIVEAEFIPEFFSMETGQPAKDGELAELVLTSLGRGGSPVIRYRTGDIVRPVHSLDDENRFVLLEGGVLGRVDDMLIIRGVNIFPSAIEQILLGFPEIVEYRLTATKSGQLDALTIEIEDRLNSPARVARELELRLGLRVEVRCVPPSSLPRFEAKARRFIDAR